MAQGQDGYTQKDVDEYKGDIQDKVQDQFSDREKVLKQLETVMRNFAYRYLATSEQQDTWPERKGHAVKATAIEKNMKEALKYAHPEAREGIVKLLQTVPYREGPTVKYTLQFECLEWGQEGHGKIRAFAEISWDHPEHTDEDKRFRFDKVFHSADALDFRNRFPRFVEQDICRVFSSEQK